jgi:hypothetical protein
LLNRQHPSRRRLGVVLDDTHLHSLLLVVAFGGCQRRVRRRFELLCAHQGIRDDQHATADNVIGTPTLLVRRSGTKGKQVALASPSDVRALVQAIDAALES